LISGDTGFGPDNYTDRFMLRFISGAFFYHKKSPAKLIAGPFVRIHL